MSAFLVKDTTISKIVDLLQSVPSVNTDKLFPSDPNELGKLLLLMNHDALFQRYNDPIPSRILYTYEPIECTLGDRTDALSCWLYQCAEGDVPQRPIYQRLEKLCDVTKESLGNRETDLSNWE